MTGLADAYTDDVGGLQTDTRLKAGVALLAVGTLLGLLAVVVAIANPTEWGARRVAGALGLLAAPALAGGVVVILPANPRLRAAAAIGASLTLLGVASFWHAYPQHWLGHGDQLTPYVTAIYFLGMLTIALCLFAGIATFKRRNDPGGTVSLRVGEGKTKYVEVEADNEESALGGGVGLLGGTPDGSVETQTNRPEKRDAESSHSRSANDDATVTRSSGSGRSGGTSSTGRTSTTRSNPATGLGTASDGGSGTETLASPQPKPDAGSDRSADVADKYCGNCEHFSYARTEQGMTPYCAHRSEYMDDVEACEDWSPNAGR
ncbi:hypothetical protein L593_13860 [Salinarchaeum sp. Harcht-Bsk1]|uniref:DUF7139 domain-containing protein n=1 Tax=Salinarchaeum sp. Harcht-Bsk1 TaxID=1333523 RepID=UPI000342489F|nr:hypothetical protein [Salinarchaeum sp. Harcht-Bsk1]AGN02711.1 hypothetical protein L593_13860 [Salinarchaeum sp. Harcht-Bsk1]